MNITPHTASLPVATVVNQATEGLRRDNNQREIITQVTATNSSAAEKGVASDKDRARTPSQASEEFDFVSLKKQAEEAVTAISDQRNSQGEQQGDEQRESEHHTSAEHSESDHQHNDESTRQEQADLKVIDTLKQRDLEVRAHERAHASTGGSLTGAPSYTFEVGPDGKKYAVGGEVSVDLSTVAGDPQATITKMKKVHAAALAPVNPSGQDIRVAASATQKILEAQSELLAETSGIDTTESAAASRSQNNRSTLATQENKNQDDINSFDTFIGETLSAQESVIANAQPSKQTLHSDTEPSNIQSPDVLKRASRVESFYFTVSQGYERPDNFQFELTA